MPQCKFGDKCYRKNADHLKEFHSEKGEEKEVAQKENGLKEKTKTSTRKKKTLDDFGVVSSGKRDAKRAKVDPQTSYYQITEAAEQFFKLAQTVNKEEPRKAFSAFNNAELVGVFEQLDGSLGDLDNDDLLLYRRFETDLPEMETCMIYEGGHFCIWRDVPNSEEFYIVHSDEAEHFPTIKLVGNKFEHMLVFMSHKKKDILKLLPTTMVVTDLKKEITEVAKQRKKIKLGTPPHEMGISVKVVNDVGYREISETAARLKQILTTIGTTTVEDLKSKNMAKINEIFSYVQFANDECDFGMGLEFGHWLFLSNYPELDKLAKCCLSVVYELLDRSTFNNIIDKHIQQRRQPL